MEADVLSLQEMIDDDLLACPRCHGPLTPGATDWRCDGTDCRYAGQPFPVVAGVPALVDFERSVLDAERLQTIDGAAELSRSQLGKMIRRVIHQENAVAPQQVAKMLTELRADAEASGRKPRVLIIGGGEVGEGLAELYADADVDIVAFDIYVSSAVQFIGDGHGIALADGSMDGVIIQAVLEHVLEPTVVAAEIERVLRIGGIVYADTPFMQQVHEGPYDFTRFTESGHRYLFRGFDRIDSGSIAGAGTALMWSIDYFVRALTRSRRLGRLAGLCFFWLSYVDRVLDPGSSVDAASSVFFLGRKSGVTMPRAEIIRHYQGAMARPA
jgi:SAM-dependent methyltransferase